MRSVATAMLGKTGARGPGKPRGGRVGNFCICIAGAGPIHSAASHMVCRPPGGSTKDQ